MYCSVLLPSLGPPIRVIHNSTIVPSGGLLHRPIQKSETYPTSSEDVNPADYAWLFLTPLSHILHRIDPDHRQGRGATCPVHQVNCIVSLSSNPPDAQDGRAKVFREPGPCLYQSRQVGVLLHDVRQAIRQVVLRVFRKCFVFKRLGISCLGLRNRWLGVRVPPDALKHRVFDNTSGGASCLLGPMSELLCT